METALRNRKHSGGSASMNILGTMTDYDVDGSHAAASRGPAVRGVRGWAVAAAVAALTMAGVDVVWLGFVAKGLFQKEIGHLLAKDINFVAAGLFYVFYVTTILLYAVRPSRSAKDAALRGAGLGFVAYTTYELTNWAVLEDWGAILVPIDIAWGVALTTTTAAASYVAGSRLSSPG